MLAEKANTWEQDFPNGYGHTSISFLKNGSDREIYIKAKSGDEIAAVELVQKCIKVDRVTQLKNRYPDALIVPVLAKERLGYNVIPLAYAKVMQNIANFKVCEDIFQINTTYHTGAGAMDRLLSRAVFDGNVKNGYNYIIADDVVTQGGTVSSLRHFIKDHGGNVSAITALAFDKESSAIALQLQVYNDLLYKFGRNELEAFLYEKRISRGIGELTNSEAKYLLKFNSIESIRAKAYEVSVQKILQENRRIFKGKSNIIDKALQPV